MWMLALAIGNLVKDDEKLPVADAPRTGRRSDDLVDDNTPRDAVGI